MAKINEFKFSDVEFYDNGICIRAKLGSDRYQNIYIKDEDMKSIINRYDNITETDSYENYVRSSGENKDIIEDAVY